MDNSPVRTMPHPGNGGHPVSAFLDTQCPPLAINGGHLMVTMQDIQCPPEENKDLYKERTWRGSPNSTECLTVARADFRACG